MARWLKRILWAIVLVVGILLVGAVAFYLLLDLPRPEGVADDEADRLARRVQDALGQDAWGGVERISWRFAGKRAHTWSRCTGQAWVSWAGHEVRLDLGAGSGEVLSKGPGASTELIDEAHKHFINDAFWLNPVSTFFDEGVTRSRVALTPDEAQALGAREEALLITYGSGGRTPGDAYLWLLGEDYRPVGWRMWVSIIPIGGLKATWERWEPVESGAEISRLHRLPLNFNLAIDQVSTGACESPAGEGAPGTQPGG